MSLATAPHRSDGSSGASPTPSPSAAAGEGEEAATGQRCTDDRGVQAVGAGRREEPLLAESLEQLEARLPLLLFLEHCDRGDATTSGDADAILRRVKLWLQDHERYRTLRFEMSPDQISSYLFSIAKDERLAEKFGIRHRQEKEKDVFDLIVYPWRAYVANFVASVPLGWSVMRDEEEGLLFSTISKGATVKVGLRKADMAGRSRVSFVTFNGHNVQDEHAQHWPNDIGPSNQDQRQLLEKVGSLQPCVGISKEHLDENAARGFLGVAHMAEIALEEKGGIFLQGDLGWTSAVVKGCLETSGGVSGILGWVGARRVFWSTECSSVAASGDGGADDRCSACRGFHRDTFLDWAITMAEEHPLHGGDAGGGGLSATQETKRPEPPAAPKKKSWVAPHKLLQLMLTKVRYQCFIAGNQVQGVALLIFLIDDVIRDVFSRYPRGSWQRMAYEDQLLWNTTFKRAKEYRFHPEILRIACRAQGVAESAAYGALSEALHLPSPSRVEQIRSGGWADTDMRSGLQIDDIKRYAQLAAAEGVDNADLVGVVTWELVQLNRNGFRANPNGTGISGLVDEKAFFKPGRGASSPEVGGRGLDVDPEGMLGRGITTQYMEARFVSTGNPKYNFIAYRGPVYSPTADYIHRMLRAVLLELATSHEDVIFDVIAAVCGGDAENMACSRHFQLHEGTVAFEARDDEESDYDYSGLKVAFRHPHHQHEVFHMNDPARIVQKVFRALCESADPRTERSLGMYRTDWNTGRSEFREFSMTTAKSLRSYGAELAASPTTATAAAAVGGTTGASRTLGSAAATATTAAAAVDGNTGAPERLASAATTATAAAAAAGGTTSAPERLASSATSTTAAAAGVAPAGGATGAPERLASSATTTTAAAVAVAAVGGTTGASRRLGPAAATATAVAAVGGTTRAPERLASAATTATAAATAVGGTTGASATTTPSAAVAVARVGGTTGASERLVSAAATATATATAAARAGGTTGASERLASAATTPTTAAAAVDGTTGALERLASSATTTTAAAVAVAPVGGTTIASERLGSAAATAAAAAAAAGGTTGASERLASAVASAIATAAAAAAAPVGGATGASERLASTPRLPRHPVPDRGACHTCVAASPLYARQAVSRTFIRGVRSQRETLDERLGCLENYEKLACHLHDLTDIFNGNYGRSDLERRRGLNKLKGYVTSGDSIHTRRLMDILDFFSKWEYELVNSPPRDGTNWQRHFISQGSWFDVRVLILGFVSLCRYVFPGGAADGGGGDVDEREGASRTRTRYVNPRTFSQGFAHPDDGPGTHCTHIREQLMFQRSKFGEGSHGILTRQQQASLTSKLGSLNRIVGAMPRRVPAERRAGNAARRGSGSGPGSGSGVAAASAVAQ